MNSASAKTHLVVYLLVLKFKLTSKVTKTTYKRVNGSETHSSEQTLDRMLKSYPY